MHKLDRVIPSKLIPCIGPDMESQVYWTKVSESTLVWVRKRSRRIKLKIN